MEGSAAFVLREERGYNLEKWTTFDFPSAGKKDDDSVATDASSLEDNADFSSSNAKGGMVLPTTVYKSVIDFARDTIQSGEETDAFLVTNLKAVEDQFKLWQQELPMVDPFYAVKCNPTPEIVKLLATLGCGFDCATKGEIDLVCNGLGTDSFYSQGKQKIAHSIVYANPAKMMSHLQHSMRTGVTMTVFDGVAELAKIAEAIAAVTADGFEVKSKLLIRITTEDSSSICQFSKKFGCFPEDAPRVLAEAKALGIGRYIGGVSFHVGSGCGDAKAYSIALANAADIFKCGEGLGFQNMDTIDIGGGFPGDTGGYGGDGMPTFQQLAAVIRVDLERITANSTRPLRFIAEPGRFFASACTTVVTKVYASKKTAEVKLLDGRTTPQMQSLYVDDGVYGSFNNVVYDHYACALPTVLFAPGSSKPRGVSLQTSVFGPTCDGLDELYVGGEDTETHMPELQQDDWLLWENMGAYTHTASFVFNGYDHVPNRRFVRI